MAILFYAFAFRLLLLVHNTVGLQVTPKSPCAALCIDSQSGDVGDPDSSSTQGSDIVCSNSAFSTTAVGQKFESCVGCLQNSSSAAMGETDTAWFLCRFSQLETCSSFY